MSKFINADGLTYLVTQLVAMMEQEAQDATQGAIVTTIDNNSTNQQIPGAKAVYDLLVASLAGIDKLTAQVVTTLPATGKTNVIYLIETAADSHIYQQHMYIGSNWSELGTTEIDLDGYWAKNELVALTNAEIQTIIDDVMA